MQGLDYASPFVLYRALILGDASEATKGQNPGSPIPHCHCFLYFIGVLLEIISERIAVAAKKGLQTRVSRKFIES